MVHGYHVIWGTYGFWLPNDPRGSWSDFVYAWELAQFGPATKSVERVEVDRDEYVAWRERARAALRYPPVELSTQQVIEVATGFGSFIEKNQLAVWACSIMPEHVHFVFGRLRYRVEQAANLLKGAATRRLVETDLHPQLRYRNEQTNRLPSMWAEGQWKVFLESEEAIVRAIRYVEDNPIRAGKPAQQWSFVSPFTGISNSGWTTYP
ncbi:MAG: transposase [Planctomycetales bacterium]|nr:transposase [Planctomycetales bacterium]